ncbi:MAG: NAD(P)/FAD-dependent oxidoreductase, partial [Alphaproteobacteria bacterium]|nr:NAD(P)/FAD-dependent oxidoreductase [Alphaproteobacteria bacterium]
FENKSIAMDGGVTVNEFLRTNTEEIWAAGDVARGPGFGGGFAVHAIQPTAVEHGRIAALNMAGQEVAYQGSLPMNVLDTMGLISASYGDWNAGGDVAVRLDAADWRYTKLAFRDDRLVGALTIGRTDMVGALRGLIQGRVKLGKWKDKLKADPTRTAEALVASFHD